MQVIRLRQAATAPGLLFEALIQLGPFEQWTMDCKLSPVQRNAESYQNPHDWAAILDIGSSDNAVETFNLQMQAGRLVRHGFVLCAVITEKYGILPPHVVEHFLT